MNWDNIIIEYGIKRLIENIIQACNRKALHYNPGYSVFHAYATVLSKHLPVIIDEVNNLCDVYMERERHRNDSKHLDIL